MGFCRRCGDIVSGPRCKCGGLAVSPSVDFSQTTADRQHPDVWSRTYVRSKSNNNNSNNNNTPSPLRERSITLPASTSRPFSQVSPNIPFRPQSTYFSRTSLGDQVSSHIESALSSKLLTSTKTGTRTTNEVLSSSDDILSDPNTSTLSKAYGSVLQPKETLKTFTCLICSIPFLPDATIYPDPADPSTNDRFLCRPCFEMNGGAKGNCEGCARPVLILTSEGGFIENAGRIWHKRCFRCDGCFKDVSNSPLVDLLGRPSCEDCFDTCLKRPRRESCSSRYAPCTPDKEKRSNIGGMKGENREESPAIEELQERLGIKTRESTPLADRTNSGQKSSPIVSDLNQRLSNLAIRASMSPKYHPNSEESISSVSPKTTEASPRGRYERFRPSRSISPAKSPQILSPSPKAKNNPVEDIERRLLRRSFAGSPSVRSSSPSTGWSHDSVSNDPSTPSLTDSGSDSNTILSSPSTSTNSFSPPQRDTFSDRTPSKLSSPKTSRADISPARATLSSPSTPCAKCSKPLFRTRSGGRFVTVPEESLKGLPPKSFHVECFRCVVCEEPFEETKNGQAIFVRSSAGCCHISCATPERIVIQPLRTKSSTTPVITPTPKQEHPLKSAPPSTLSFPRFGGGMNCPGCRTSVSPMERGVVPGPQGSRWHAACLVCGGKGAQSGPRRNVDTPGCGKRLDSGAKTDGEGGVWCRECLLLVPSSSPIKQEYHVRPLEPSFTGGHSRFPRSEGNIAAQFTGTTIARQFTGLSALTSQLTGGGLSPTRQLPKDLNRSPSPTKMPMGEGRRILFPRPKSVVGVRGKSLDEGRGMYLVRQMTGGGGNGPGL